MNKKVLALICCLALITLGLTACKGNRDKVQTPTETGAAMAATETTQVTVPEETTEATEETMETTEATEETTQTTEATEATGATEPKKETEGNKDQNTTSTDPTIPPENVQMGTTEGEKDDGILDEESQGSGTPSTQPTQPSQPEETTPIQPEETEPSDGNVLGENFDLYSLTYEGYHALTGEQQKAVIELFGSPDDFMVWYKAVEAIYKAEHPDIEIGGDGNVDFGG